MTRALASICALLVAVAAVPATAQVHGRGTAAEERLIAHCIHRSARGKPWLEKTLWGLRDQEGGWIGAEVRNSDGSYDLGPMQINSWWFPRLARLLGRPPMQIRRWLREDPCFNVEATRWLLLIELARSRDYWAMVSRYHSHEPWRQRRYVAAIVANLNWRTKHRNR